MAGLTPSLQCAEELDQFLDLVRSEEVTSFLEIGSKFGSTLNAIGRAMPQGSRIVSVDLPNGTRSWRESGVELQYVVTRLIADGYDARLLWGDSTDPNIISRVAQLGPFDLVFIDANHTRAYLEKDWANFGPLGRIVAFHDISWRRASEWVGVRIDVPEFWDGIKGDYRHQEFRLCPTGKNNGIGVLWR